MKRTVTITFDIDVAEYHEGEDTPPGTIELVAWMLSGDADFPDDVPIIITCGGETRFLPMSDKRSGRHDRQPKTGAERGVA